MRKLIISPLLLCVILLISCGTETTPVYTLSSTSNPSEAGTVTPSSGEYDEGEEVELTAVSEEGWLFDQWQDDASGSQSTATITMDTDKNVTARFVKREYPLTIDTEGEGSVSEQIVQEKITDYEHGTVVELTANPADGSEFAEWSGDVTGTDNPVEVTVDDTMEMTAVFNKKTYSLSTSTTGEGALSFDPDQEHYEHGTSVEVSAAPETGWEFAGWDGDISGTDDPLTITIDAEKEITAIFEEKESFTLHENEVTIVCEGAEPGDKEIVNGIEYEAVDRALLDQKIDNEEDVTTVCTTNITDMAELFKSEDLFNQDLSSWDVSNVTSMLGMFQSAENFNRNIGSWDVSNVGNMSGMFWGASNFNKNINNWDVSNVSTMGSMFRSTDAFNQDLSSWDVSSVGNMASMFLDAERFNGDIGTWDVDNVGDMSNMFWGASDFNQDISGWCVIEISSEPSNFSRGTSLDDEYHPVWGTCS